MAFQAVIFDLDGTILNTLEDIADAMNHVLARHGLPARSLEEIRLGVGNGVRRLVCASVPENVRTDEETISRYHAEMTTYYLAHASVKTRPYPGISELLSQLSERGVALCVLSNKTDALTRALVSQWFSGIPFAFVFGERDGVPLKPDPASSLDIAVRLRLSPEQMLFVGDSPQDMLTAKRAGMFSVGVLWGFRTEQELAAAGADALARTPKDIARLFSDPPDAS